MSRPPEASWHADYRDTAYIYIGGLPFDLTEGDVVTICSQYGEPVYVNLIRDKETGKSKGFAFLKYEDQRSTDLAVDNLGGSTVLGRMLRVDHTRYKRRDDEEEVDNVAKLMGDATTSENKEEKPSDGHRGSGDVDREERRPMLKEERELQELIQSHDDEDPMKEFLIEEKKEEVARAVEKYRSSEKKSSRRRGDSRERSSRHSRRHRSRERRDRDDRSPGRERTRRRSTDRVRESQRDRTPVMSRSDRDRDDRSPARERRPRRRSEERSRRDRTPKRSRSPESRRHRSDRDRDDRR